MNMFVLVLAFVGVSLAVLPTQDVPWTVYQWNTGRCPVPTVSTWGRSLLWEASSESDQDVRFYKLLGDLDEDHMNYPLYFWGTDGDIDWWESDKYCSSWNQGGILDDYLSLDSADCSSCIPRWVYLYKSQTRYEGNVLTANAYLDLAYEPSSSAWNSWCDAATTFVDNCQSINGCWETSLDDRQTAFSPPALDRLQDWNTYAFRGSVLLSLSYYSVYDRYGYYFGGTMTQTYLYGGTDYEYMYQDWAGLCQPRYAWDPNTDNDVMWPNRYYCGLYYPYEDGQFDWDTDSDNTDEFPRIEFGCDADLSECNSVKIYLPGIWWSARSFQEQGFGKRMKALNDRRKTARAQRKTSKRAINWDIIDDYKNGASCGHSSAWAFPGWQ